MGVIGGTAMTAGALLTKLAADSAGPGTGLPG